MSPESSKRKFDPAQILSQAFSYLKHVRLMLICFAFAILVGIGYFIYATPVYQARSLVYFQTFGSVMNNHESAGTTMHPALLSRSLTSRLNSQRVKIGAAQRLGLLGSEATYEDFGAIIPAVRIGIVDARHLEVTVHAYDPEVVRSFCGALVEEFQAFQESSWKEFRDEALDRYAVQLKELESKVTENVDSLSEMERNHQFTEITIEQQNLLQIPKDIVETREKLTRMDAIRETLEKYESANSDSQNILSILSLLSTFEEETDVKVGDVIRRSGNSVLASPEKPTSEVQVVQPSTLGGVEPWRKLEKEKRLLENQIEEASKTFLPDHPRMRELTQALEGAERKLRTEMLILREKFDLEYERLTEKLAQLLERLPEYQKITQELGRTSLEFNSFEQAQKMWDTAREKLSEKLAAVSFAEEFDWIQLRFKGHTSLRDENPISPNKRKLVMMSVLLGIAGAIGLPTILNLLDTTSSTVTQLEDGIGMKGIGIVPLSDPDFLEAVHRSPAQGATVPNYLLECFRVIRANIGLDSSVSEEISSQVILITSARPQEGKTTQAANLAWAYHSLGERVLLVDCDLRRGRVHDLLKLDNSIGMSKMLIGDATPTESVCTTSQEGFEAIPRGPIIPGATELLCQEAFHEQIQEWRKSYDRVILDCPPVLGLSESSSLQRLADGVVLVIRSEVTSIKDVRDAVSLLRKIGAHFYGFVLNGVDLSKVGNYYQYYYYSAPYYDQFDEDIEEAAYSSPEEKPVLSETSEISLEVPVNEISYSIEDVNSEESFDNEPDSDELDSKSKLEKITKTHSDEDELWNEISEEKAWIQSSEKTS